MSVFFLGNLLIKDRFIRRWVHKEGFSGFKRYVTTAEDKELEAKIAVVEKYNIRIPELVERIGKCHIEDLDFAGKEKFFTSHQEEEQMLLSGVSGLLMLLACVNTMCDQVAALLCSWHCLSEGNRAFILP